MRVLVLVGALALLGVLSPAAQVLSGGVYEAFTLLVWGGSLMLLAQVARARRHADATAADAPRSAASVAFAISRMSAVPRTRVADMQTEVS
jgi:hypothetical protein